MIRRGELNWQETSRPNPRPPQYLTPPEKNLKIPLAPARPSAILVR